MTNVAACEARQAHEASALQNRESASHELGVATDVARDEDCTRFGRQKPSLELDIGRTLGASFANESKEVRSPLAMSEKRERGCCACRRCQRDGARWILDRMLEPFTPPHSDI